MKTLLFLVLAAFSGALLAQEPFQVKVTGQGQPLLLIPGLASGADTWDTTIAHYQDRYECHAFTMAGFAGVPRVPAPLLDRYRDSLADYIRKHNLVKPVIVGHSLGGLVALAIGVKYPDLAGKLIIVDSFPFLFGAFTPGATPASARQSVAAMRQSMSQMTDEMWANYTKSGASTRMMVTKDSDFQRLVAWGLASDRSAVTDAMCELFTADLRDDIARIKVPVLVLLTSGNGTPAARDQYAKLAGVEIKVTETARHFIMWDDPEWMFSQTDAFLARQTPAPRVSVSAK
jgi:pimeloyl-ACP methyl ester carboxylesterase